MRRPGPTPALHAASDRDDRSVRFNGGIGVDPITNVTAGPPAAAVLNIVRGVSPGGVPWRIGSLRAEWNDNGHVNIKGTGLLLAGGNSIGTPGPITSVAASFFCGRGSTTPLLTIGAIPLDAAGDFNLHEDGFQSPAEPCLAPVLLIRSSPTGPWFAAGFPVVDLDD